MKRSIKHLVVIFSSQKVFLLFSSKSIIVSALTFGLNSFCLFLYMVLGSVLISFFTCSCPVFPELGRDSLFEKTVFYPLKREKTIFSPLHILASFVIDLVTIGV